MRYATTSRDGATATENLDYTAKSDTLDFAPGEASKDVLVTVRGDDVANDGDETFFLDLEQPPGGAPWAGTAGPWPPSPSAPSTPCPRSACPAPGRCTSPPSARPAPARPPS